MRILRRVLSLVAVASLIAGCPPPEEVPPPDAGIPDAGSDTGTVRGELTVASLSSAGAGGGGETLIAGASAAPGDVSLSHGALEGAVASTPGGARSAIAAPSRDTIARLVRSLPSTRIEPAAVAPRGEQVVPGEFLIVRRKEGARGEVQAARFAAALPEHRVRALPAPSSQVEHLKVTHADGRPLTVAQTRALLPRLAADPSVVSVEPNRRVDRTATPNDAYYPLQWHLPAMRLPKAWDVRTAASDVVVAVIDSGILQHPDLVPALLPGADLISSASSAGDGDGRDMDPTDMGGDLPGGDSSWHGTHVAGTIGAVGNNASGVTGVAWNTRIVPVRALGVNGGTAADIVAAVSWAIGEPVSGLTDNAHPADVVNMSLGGDGSPSAALQAVIDRGVQRGVVFAVAAGNDNEDTANKFPCNQAQVICVGATRLSPVRASYSNFGAQVDVMAPGGETAEDQNNDGYPDGVLSTTRSTDASGSPAWAYAFHQGTSMATPHVAGLIALMKSARAAAALPPLGTGQITTLLKDTAYAGARCSEGCGAGLIDAYAAVLRATDQEVPVGPGELSLASSSMRLTGAQTSRLLIFNVGGLPLTVAATFSSTDGGAVSFPEGSSLTLEAGASKSLAIQAGAGLANGAYTGTLVLTPSTGPARNVDVRIQVGPAAGDGLPVLLVFAYLDDNEEWQVGAGGSVPPNASGRYLYRASEVPVGEYLVMGAVDDDQDEEFAEEGERLGMYPTLDAPAFIKVSKGQTLEGIDFALTPQLAVGLPSEGAAVGQACTSDAACGAGGLCNTGIPGGYCTRSCASASCPAGSACFVFGSGASASRMCMATCTPPGGGQGSCRAGILCHDNGAGGGYCHANCNDMVATFCGAKSCAASGYCE